MVYALGQIKEVITEPGLKFKLPPPFQNVSYIDTRIQTLDSPDTRADAHGREAARGDRLAGRWRITDPRQYIRNNGVDMRNLEARCRRSSTRRSTRKSPSAPCAACSRPSATRSCTTCAARLVNDAKSCGIDVIDVRIKRVDFVGNITESVYRRMEAERKQVANELRSTGAAEGEKIRADADRQREVIVAKAYRDAQKIKGEGDAKASAIYAEAFGRDPQFAQFYRSLEAYKASFNKQGRRDGARSGQRFLQGDARRGRCAGRAARPASSAQEIALAAHVLGRGAQRRGPGAGAEGLLPFISPAAGAASSSRRSR